MTTLPKILNQDRETVLPRQLFSDLQLDRVLSEETISVLMRPCGRREILRRGELFACLEREDVRARVREVLSCLIGYRQALEALRGAAVPLDRYHGLTGVLARYLEVGEALMSLSDCGEILSEVAAYFAREEIRQTCDRMRADHTRAVALLRAMHRGLLSFADKDWLTPRTEGRDEFEEIAACVERLGLVAQEKRRLNVRVDATLSDAICRLHRAEAEELEALMGNYDMAALAAPCAYIADLKFLLEIEGLMARAAEVGAVHCLPTVAETPRMWAREMYDISLLAKDCTQIVPNDADFTSREPFFFLTGANGGGKTTYLRAVGGQLVLFLAGCPVFAREAEIYPFDLILAHFPRDERFEGVGRLDEERRRVGEMLAAAAGKTAFWLFNETFSGTDERRGFDLLCETVEKLRQAGQFGLYVTHFHEVAGTDLPLLSAQVDEADGNRRTWRIVKMRGNASSYAADILKKYGLDEESLKARRCGDAR